MDKLINDCINSAAKEDVEALSMLAKDDTGKPDLTYLPYSALTDLAHVAEFGANKYGRGSWDVPDPDGSARRRFIAAALRHLHKRASGEKFDDESGYDHLAHAAMSCIFALAISKEEHNKEIFEERMAPKTSANISFFCERCEEVIECVDLPNDLVCDNCRED